ncbi:MAG: hypothetical protein A2126_00510 [Candidatus Woykebacteria bacterium GWB1_45_5]|uniref:Deoxynucleoside kinase domain-containing protein n=1 Tax=Candidatus Woykebacteria bacterium GWB1_45_5 TaxID=1802592 RepID=A0A1G1W904_9BACT|nr:MAG: hypothetical protein A2126_00510 [Candidatus Woykebacteria bacterium GWB1_45_5]
MKQEKSLKIAIIGVDGSGKSSCFKGVLEELSKIRIAGIGDEVLISEQGNLIKPAINYLNIKSFLGKRAKTIQNRTLYKLAKFSELISRVKVHDEIETKYNPEIILTDGSPLINALGWGSFYHPDFYSEKQGKIIMKYISGTKIPLSQKVFYLKHLPEIFLVNKLGIKFQKPTVVFFLKVNPAKAIKRIQIRGDERQIHEKIEFLAGLQKAYELICNILSKTTRVYTINTDNKNLTEVINTIITKINENN